MQGGILDPATSVIWPKVLEPATVAQVQCLSWQWAEPSPPPCLQSPSPLHLLLLVVSAIPPPLTSFQPTFSLFSLSTVVYSSLHLPLCSAVASLPFGSFTKKKKKKKKKGREAGVSQLERTCLHTKRRSLASDLRMDSPQRVTSLPTFPFKLSKTKTLWYEEGDDAQQRGVIQNTLRRCCNLCAAAS